jgi:uncharacterized protein (TIGR03084 family)
MQALCSDLRAEYGELADLVGSFSGQQWELPTGFFHWTPWDEIAHLLYFDEAALDALRDPGAFAREASDLLERTTRGGEPISSICRARYGHLAGPDLTERWRPVHAQLCARLAEFDARARLPWYGPTMSARSFATARLMECWAHGQDVWDAVRRRRPVHPRLKHIAHLGVSTFGWSFSVHGRQPPGPQPYVDLEGPAGERWSWGEPGGADAIRGDAQDFCLVVTQRRHLQDTGLEVTGATAAAWLDLAQCFAGEAATGPAPGVRRIDYADVTTSRKTAAAPPP